MLEQFEDIEELIKKHQFADSVVNEIKLLATKSAASSSITSYRQSAIGCSLVIAQSMQYKAEQKLKRALQIAQQEDQADTIQDEELGARDSAANRLIFPGRKLRPSLNIKSLPAFNLPAYTTPPIPKLMPINKLKPSKLVARLKSLLKRISVYLVVKYLAKKLLNVYKQNKKTNARRQKQLKLEKLKLKKKRKLKRPQYNQFLQDEIQAQQNAATLRQIELSNNIFLLNKLKLSDPFAQNSALLKQQQEQTSNDLAFRLKKQQARANKQALDLQAFNAEQDRILQDALNDLLQRHRATIQQQYKRLAAERKRYETFIANIVEAALHAARQKQETEARYKLTNLEIKRKRKALRLQKADAWLNATNDNVSEISSKIVKSILDLAPSDYQQDSEENRTSKPIITKLPTGI